MSKNVFTVDLGDLKLSDAQHSAINIAIQKTVSNELVNLGSTGKIVFVPVHNWQIGPILNGIIARNINSGIEKELGF